MNSIHYKSFDEIEVGDYIAYNGVVGQVITRYSVHHSPQLHITNSDHYKYPVYDYTKANILEKF